MASAPLAKRLWKVSIVFPLGNSMAGTGCPRNWQSGSQPLWTSKINKLSFETKFWIKSQCSIYNRRPFCSKLLSKRFFQIFLQVRPIHRVFPSRARSTNSIKRRNALFSSGWMDWFTDLFMMLHLVHSRHVSTYLPVPFVNVSYS